MLGRRILCAAAALGIAASGLLVACGGETPPSAPAAAGSPSAAAAQTSPRSVPSPVATVSDRYGPSWTGRLGDTVQIDWSGDAGGASSERVAVLAVKRLADRTGDGGDEGYVAYKRHYAIKVRLTSLDALAARWPAAYQLLQLSDGAREEGGVWGLGDAHGPDPSRAGRSSVGWLHQRAQQGFTPTAVVIHLPGGTVRWRLD
jgi:hypothetical protein